MHSLWKIFVKNSPTGICYRSQGGNFYSKSVANNAYSNVQGIPKGEISSHQWLTLCSQLIKPKTVLPACARSIGSRQFSILSRNHDVQSSLLRNWNGNSNHTKSFQQFQQQRCFRTSPRQNALPPIVLIVMGRLAKVGAMIVGRTARRWWQKLPPEEKAKYAGRVRRNRYIVSGALGAAAFGSFVYYDTHVQVTPYTERKRFLAFTNDQVIAMSQLELEAHLEEHERNIIPAKSGTDVYTRIVRVAQRLLKANEGLPQLQGLEWTVTVVNEDSTINAFVLPCGSIFVFSGLLKVCDTDDQLGIILAHEMAHAIMGHGAEKASFLHLLDLLFVIPLAALWAFLPTDITAALTHWITSTLSQILMELPHSRFIEEEADQVGLILAARACFDIREAPVVWAKIGLMEEDNISIEWLSTHPSHERRQAQLEEILPIGLETREQCLFILRGYNFGTLLPRRIHSERSVDINASLAVYPSCALSCRSTIRDSKLKLIRKG